MLYVETDSRSNREDATNAAAGGRNGFLVTLFATLAGLLHAAAARLERFDARRVELRAFRALRRRNPTVHLALLSASGGDERDAADSWTQVLAEPAEPKRFGEGPLVRDAREWAERRQLDFALRLACGRPHAKTAQA